MNFFVPLVSLVVQKVQMRRCRPDWLISVAAISSTDMKVMLR